MFIDGFPGGILPHCSVVGQFEEIGWNLQCPVSGQWSKKPENVCGFGVYNQNYVKYPTQCYRNNPYAYVPDAVAPVVYNAPQNVYQNPMRYVPQPMVPNLPCHEKQDWDYNNMCFNVNGQPCQYTNIVDLEDFM